jgi:hypothetical protein
MVGSSTANSESFQVTTPSDREIRMTRLFNAPRKLVFEAMTKPEHVSTGGVDWERATRFRSVKSIFASEGRGASSTGIPRGRLPSTANTAKSRRPAGLSSPRSSSSFPTTCRWLRPSSAKRAIRRVSR